jgi:hypothetical protein
VPCTKNPCKNDAQCINGYKDAYKCNCSDGYSGKNCEIGELIIFF